MENKPDHSMLRNNPVFVICIACLIAGLMMSISIIGYVRSDTRKTIEQIQANNTLKQDIATLPKNGEVTTDYVNTTEKNISKDIQSHVDDTDFSPDELTDSSLGL
jgi:hypothetical protein